MNDDQISAEDKSQIQRMLRDLAAEVLRQEQANPGQDPEYVRWAQNTLSGATAPPPSPAPSAVSAQPQPSASEGAPLDEGGEGVLQIRQTSTPGQTIQPTEAPNRSDNGQGAAQ
jgi:hypothetical protein